MGDEKSTITFTCPGCQHRMRSVVARTPSKVRCPACATVFFGPHMAESGAESAVCEHCLRPTREGACVATPRLRRAAGSGFNPFEGLSPAKPGTDLDLVIRLAGITSEDGENPVLKGVWDSTLRDWRERVQNGEGPEWQPADAGLVPAWYLCNACVNKLEQFLLLHGGRSADGARPTVSGLCDLCGEPTDEEAGCIRSAEEMQQAMRSGLDPLAIIRPTESGTSDRPVARIMELSGIGDDEHSSVLSTQWKRRAMSTAGPWLLCPRCASSVAEFVTGTWGRDPQDGAAGAREASASRGGAEKYGLPRVKRGGIVRIVLGALLGGYFLLVSLVVAFTRPPPERPMSADARVALVLLHLIVFGLPGYLLIRWGMGARRAGQKHQRVREPAAPALAAVVSDDGVAAPRLIPSKGQRGGDRPPTATGEPLGRSSAVRPAVGVAMRTNGDVRRLRGIWKVSGGSYHFAFLATDSELFLVRGPYADNKALVAAIVFLILIFPVGLICLLDWLLKLKHGREALDAFENSDVEKLRGCRRMVLTIPRGALARVSLDEQANVLSVEGTPVTKRKPVKRDVAIVSADRAKARAVAEHLSSWRWPSQGGPRA